MNRISLIVPTWNEELWLPRLLDSISQVNTIMEIIVADNFSTDNTVRIAKNNRCKITIGGTPPFARNMGSAIATGNLLVFCDADVIIPESMWKLVNSTFSNEKVVALHVRLVPTSEATAINLCYSFMHYYFRMLNQIGVNQGLANFLVVRRRGFELLKGFDDSIRASEDLDFVRRLGEVGLVKYASDEKVLVSPRRFISENPIVFVFKCLFWAALRLLKSKRSIIPYSWKAHAKESYFLEKEWILKNYVNRKGRNDERI